MWMCGHVAKHSTRFGSILQPTRLIGCGGERKKKSEMILGVMNQLNAWNIIISPQ